MSETSLVLPDTPTAVSETPADVQIPEGAAPIANIEPHVEPILAPVEGPDGQVHFDASTYALDVPNVDGVHAEKIIIAFAGSVELDIHDEKDLAIFNALTLGKEVDLRVAGIVADRPSPLKTDKETGAQTMIRKTKIAVHTVYVLSPEELG
jgi:hypothetical protein